MTSHDGELQLSEPTPALLEDFAAFRDEFAGYGEKDIHGIGGMAGDDMAAAILRCGDEALGRNLPEGWVPATTFWLVRDGTRIIGTCNLRHRLNAALEYENGHIGYSVRPSERRKGYGTRLLALTLRVARQMGMLRVLITCDKDNSASVGVIRNNGGILENEVVSRTSGKIVQRYWIAL